jgi:hypothetical protein
MLGTTGLLWLVTLLTEAGLEVLVHLGGEDDLSAGVAVLHYISAFSLADDLLLSRPGVLHLMLLDAGEELSGRQCSGAFGLEADGVDEFEVVPVDVALAHLLGHLFLLAASLLLACLVVVVHQSAS